jgi:hypothetical protein
MSVLSVGGCATSTGGSPMDARAEAPAPPTTSAYPSLGNMELEREDHATMTPDERSKLKQELIAARDHQAAVAKAQGDPEPTKP